MLRNFLIKFLSYVVHIMHMLVYYFIWINVFFWKTHVTGIALLFLAHFLFSQQKQKNRDGSKKYSLVFPGV